MANGVGESVTEDPAQGGATPGPDPGEGAPGGAGGPPQGGGPVLAALARRQTAPQVSAPGPGDHGDAMTKVQSGLALIQQALPGLPQGSPIHLAASQAVTRLSKHLAQGAPTAGLQRTQIGDLLRNTMRNALLQSIMGQQGGSPGGPGGGPAPPLPGGAPPQAPMPSTPLPGA